MVVRSVPDYKLERDTLSRFLREFVSFGTDLNGNDFSDKKYLKQLQAIANRATDSLVVELDDLYKFTEDSLLISHIQSNTMRYIKLFAEATDDLIPSPTAESEFEDVFDILVTQRQQRNNDPEDLVTADASQQLPPELKRRFDVLIQPLTLEKPMLVRDIRSHHVGHLVTFHGVVTRISEVKPQVVVATYTCDECGFEIYQQVAGRQFTPLETCPSERCRTNHTPGRLHLQTRGSRFVRFQELRVQELARQVPVGHVPRSATVHAHGRLTRQCTPGEEVVVSGVFLPVPSSGGAAAAAGGRRAMGLLTETYVEAMAIHRQRLSSAGIGNDMMSSSSTLTSAGMLANQAELEARRAEMEAEHNRFVHEVNQVRTQLGSNTAVAPLYEALSRSIAPEIFGHEDVKKALLLQLIGGVTRKMSDGMSIRGDINVCLMGDPGVAKSQLLKYVSHLAPRGVYTTGKGSSGVGLTAAVVKDAYTGDMTLEGGALVLADMGIACIDEFDKMDESDRTAIHEVMEQQTISIAKAGITTTLNARTSILAAANPAFGRYNKRRSPTENINLPAALLSRFDLLFLLLDRHDRDQDLALARHICHVHRVGVAPRGSNAGSAGSGTVSTANRSGNGNAALPVFDASFLRRYVTHARRLEPMVPESLTDHIVNAYVSMREQEAKTDSSETFTYTTARTLLAILRLSQGLARLRLSDRVSRDDVEEAIRLMTASKQSLAHDDDRDRVRRADPLSAIYDLIRARASLTDSATVRWDDIMPQAIATGYTEAQLRECLSEYQSLNVWQVSADSSSITFLNTL